ncbi:MULTISPECIES: RRXRR domain-containing protein [Trichocoleus]|uniref:RRXRR domain-containing protein n=1 Tax=Trichocoleus desertorum GB2-A4 TaxID=2933944 RepID=A0ABV0JCI7_9CYAN|nr:RRXRR domain-containing protein [Trichocoleus sp. FACHB-46]MBD1864155.1 RRXRR domain-containing protein [Trichocoleus sp. FACHB-46]
MRIPVISHDNQPLMPTTPARARKWLASGKAIKRWSDLGLFYVQLTQEPSGRDTQPIAVGVDPGKLYSGIGVQSAQATLFLAHLILPFQTVKDRMEQRRMMRRGRRGRRINRKVAYSQRAHRQVRFDNRKQRKLPASVRANRQLELRVVTELCKLFPVSQIVYEYVEARGSKSFSPVMVGQRVMLDWLSKLAPVKTQLGYETAKLRTQLGLVKTKAKASQSPESHAVDGLALACSEFIQYESFHTANTHGHQWMGSVQITASLFRVIRRPPISKRQLHLMVPAKGGVRRRYGGTVTRHGFRKGDLVQAEMAGRVSIGWVSGDTQKHVSVSDCNWKRLGQFAASKVMLIARNTGVVASGASNPTQPPLLSLPASRGRGFSEEL